MSYAHEDTKYGEQVYTHLCGGLVDAEVWMDTYGIRVGDKWTERIDAALKQADAAVVLVSASFLASRFIKRHEIPHLLFRHETHGMPIVPILVAPCAWKAVPWISERQMRPRWNKALAELKGAHADRALGELVDELTRMLGLRHSSDFEVKDMRAHFALGAGPAVTLLRYAVLYEQDGPEADAVAHRLAKSLARLTGLSGAQLLDAARFCIEYSLLATAEGERPRILELLGGDPTAGHLKLFGDELRNRSLDGFASEPIGVTTRFFVRARSREAAWKAYFDALARPDVLRLPRQDVSTLCTVSSVGFLAPQFLLTGLMARFDSDWQPVLNAYSYALGAEAKQPMAFESLQASQWNCWLVWGPSIPVCQCEQWQGLYSLQYGYGDESNTLPVLESSPASQERDGLLAMAEHLASEQREASLVRVRGKLRWAPWFLREYSSTERGPSPLDATIDLAAYDDSIQGGSPDPDSQRVPAARAQAALYEDAAVRARRHADGLVLDVQHVSGSALRGANVPAPREYFSAYRWVMFLVARATMDGRVGPVRRRGRPYPRWPEHEGMRAQVEEARLWEDLLPVFVHANVADAAALEFAKRMLADSALSMLRQVWARRSALFGAEDLDAGLRFYLVCSSDYTGCGCARRFPGAVSVVDLLRERLRDESDRAFAAAIELPGDEQTATDRPWGLRGFYSACHLGELVGDYYSFVTKDRAKRGKHPSRAPGTLP